MINYPLNKLLFFDIETVGIAANYSELKSQNPDLAYLFEVYYDWFKKRFNEDSHLSIEDMFYQKAALVTEFSKIVCASFSFIDHENKKRKQSFSSKDEKELLLGVQSLLNRVEPLGFVLCGHNIKNFDIPVISKRMVVNGLLPPKILPSYDTKPWDIKALDTKDIWQFGQFGSIGSLELMCLSLGVPSSKTSEVTGNKVHKAYWEEDQLEAITKYCEQDVDVLIDVVTKLKELK